MFMEQISRQYTAFCIERPMSFSEDFCTSQDSRGSALACKAYEGPWDVFVVSEECVGRRAWMPAGRRTPRAPVSPV